MRKILLLTIIFCVFSSLGSYSKASDNVETTGSVLRILLPAIAFSMTFGYDDQEGRHQFYKSFLFAVGVTYGLKAAIDKECPNGYGNDAFPSGHSAMAFSSASFIQRRYGLKYGAWAYAGAAFVALSRIDADKHDLVDVCAGTLIGMGGTWLFSKPYKKNLSALPLISNEKIGITLTSIW